MTSQTRLANKTLWALEDMQALLIEARRDWQLVMVRAEQSMDVRLLLPAARLRDHLAEMERITREARAGEYHGR